jgi:hypothetical protein
MPDPALHSSVDPGDPEGQSHVIQEVTGGQVIGAIHQEVVSLGQGQSIVWFKAHRMGLDAHLGVQGMEAASRRNHLGLSHPRRIMEDLALEIRELDPVGIHDPQRPHPGRDQIECYRRSQPTGPHHEDPGLPKTRLPQRTHFGEGQMTGVPHGPQSLD